MVSALLVLTVVYLIRWWWRHRHVLELRAERQRPPPTGPVWLVTIRIRGKPHVLRIAAPTEGEALRTVLRQKVNPRDIMECQPAGPGTVPDADRS